MKERTTWYSTRVERDVTLVRWGRFGMPVLLFPTAGGDAEEVERFDLVSAVGHLVEAGKVKVYSCDSVNGRALLAGEGDARHRTWLMVQFLEYIRCEVVPAIRHDCRSNDIGIVAGGASIGAYNALAALCRSPADFTHAIGMSGTYDLARFLDGPTDDDFVAASPLSFLPMLDPGGALLRDLRQRSVILATGQGANEDVGATWHAAHVLGTAGVPNRVDVWGLEWPHDWHTWRAMLPVYLDQILGG